jgi:multiple sugar transport system substrate-binding protein
VNRARATLALATCLGLVVAACGGGGGGSKASGGASGTITLGFWDATFKPGYEQIVAAFEKTHPNIKVKLEVTPATQYWTKLEASVQSGQAPDLFWMNEPNFARYQNGGALAALPGGFDSSSFPAALMKSYAVGGKQYGLPWTAVTVGLWFNKKLFDAAHVKYPDDTWTWDDVQAAAKKLTDKAHGVYGLAAPLVNQETYYNTMLQAGGYVVSPDKPNSGWDTPQGISGLRFWTNLIADGASPSLQQMTDTTPDALFQSGKLAMLYGGTWHAGTFAADPATKDSADVTVLPKGQMRATTVEGASYVMYGKTKHQSAAWEFMQFLVSKQAQLIQAKTGIVVPARADAQQAWVDSLPQYHLQAFVDELAYAQPYPASADTPKWQDKEAGVLGPAWSGKQDVTAAAAAMGKLTDGALSAEHR